MVRLVDKERLFKAVTLQSQVAEINFAFWEKLLLHDALNPIKVEQLGEITIPVSVKNIKRLKEACSLSYYGKGCNQFFNSSKRLSYEIEGQKLSSTISDELNLNSLVMQHLDLPSDLMKVQAKLDQLVLYEAGGHYHRILELEKEYVEDGHDGGRLKVEYRGKEQVFENYIDSDQCVYVSSFYGNCNHSMEPLKRGSKLTLIFDLVWENVENIPQDFPVFLNALKEIKESLLSWIATDRSTDCQFKNIEDNMFLKAANVTSTYSFQPKGEDKDKDECKRIKSEHRDSNISISSEDDNEDEYQDTHFHSSTCSEESCSKVNECKRIESEHRGSNISISSEEYQDEDDYEDEYQDTHLYSSACSEESCSKVNYIETLEDVLYFVLEEKYEENDFGFRQLRGKDRDLAQLLQHSVFLEKHLAVVSQTVLTTIRDIRGPVNSHNWCECQPYEKKKSSNRISQWEDSECMSWELNIGINFNKQCVGPRRNLPKSDFEKTDLEYPLDDSESNCGACEITTREKSIKHFILVIWPKHQSFHLYCRYGLRSLLDNMELQSSSRWIKNNMEKNKSDLRKIISFCSSDPRNMWNQTLFKKGELTEKLLRLCIDLRAREEGLDLLKILSVDWRVPQERTSNIQEMFEGIQTEKVAKAIAEFECRVTGWKDCANLIKQMIPPNRIKQQLLPTIRLAQFFLNFDCYEGAKVVGDCISSSFNNIDRKHTLNLKQMEIQAYVELIVTLEENTETSHHERITSFVTLFSKLESSIQCYVVLQLEAQVSSRFKDLESCKIMFQELCKALTVCDLCTGSSIEKNVKIDLISFFFRIGKEELLTSLISNIFRAEVASSRKCYSRSIEKTLFETIISSE